MQIILCFTRYTALQIALPQDHGTPAYVHRSWLTGHQLHNRETRVIDSCPDTSSGKWIIQVFLDYDSSLKMLWNSICASVSLCVYERVFNVVKTKTPQNPRLKIDYVVVTWLENCDWLTTTPYMSILLTRNGVRFIPLPIRSHVQERHQSAT